MIMIGFRRKIDSYNPSTQRWGLLLDDPSWGPDSYAIWYDAIYKYVDQGASTLNNYKISAVPVYEVMADLMKSWKLMKNMQHTAALFQ